MSNLSTIVTVLTVIVGASGWLATLITWAKWRREIRETLLKQEKEFKDKEARILQEVQNDLDSGQFVRTLEILNAERRGQKPPPDQFSGEEMRRLPARLEELASHWEFQTISIRAVYDRIGSVVVMCDESKILWQDEQSPKSEISWRLFNKFAKAIQDERRHAR